MRRLTLLIGVCIVGTVLIFTSLKSLLAVRDNVMAQLPTISQKTRLQEDNALPPRVLALYETLWGSGLDSQLLHHLSERCTRTEFQQNLYLDCAGIFGGLTTVMSIIKSCIRLALETRMNIIVPVISARDASDLSSLHAADTDISNPARYKHESMAHYSTFFDEDHLVKALGVSCPKMQVLRRNQDKTIESSLERHTYVRIEQAPSFAMGPYAGRTSENWLVWYQNAIEKAVQEQTGSDLSSGLQTSVTGVAPLTFFDVTADDSLGLWNDLEMLIRFPPAVRNLATASLDHLRDRDGRLVPYYGVHFRTEADTLSAGFESAENQIDRIFDSANQAWDKYGHGRNPNLKKTIFLACGDQERIAQFQTSASRQGWAVMDKYTIYDSITSGTDAIAFDDRKNIGNITALTFDQQAGVDLAIMVLSDFFIGVWNSAFSVTVAHARSASGRYKGSALLNWHDSDARAGRTSLSLDDPKAAYQCCL